MAKWKGKIEEKRLVVQTTGKVIRLKSVVLMEEFEVLNVNRYFLKQFEFAFLRNFNVITSENSHKDHIGFAFFIYLIALTSESYYPASLG